MIRFLNWKIVHIPVSSMIFAFINKNNLGVSIKIHPYGNFLVRTHVFGIDLELHSFVCRQIGFRHSINIRTVSSLFSAVHLSLLGWSGVEIICTVHVALPKQPIKYFSQALRAYAFKAYQQVCILFLPSHL